MPSRESGRTRQDKTRQDKTSEKKIKLKYDAYTYSTRKEMMMTFEQMLQAWEIIGSRLTYWPINLADWSSTQVPA